MPDGIVFCIKTKELRKWYENDLKNGVSPLYQEISCEGRFMYIVCMSQSKSDIARRIKSIIRQYDPQAKVYLYGSRAKDTSHKHSDWDVLILLSSETLSSEIERKITSSLYDLEIETGELISPSIYSQEEWHRKYWVTPYYRNVMREGQLL